MTAFAGTRTVYRPSLPPVGRGAFETVRGSLREFRSAFRALGSAPTRQHSDYDVLLMLGRD